MNEEIKQEIIKAYIYGYSETEIMQAMGVTAAVVKEVLADTAAVEEKTKYMKEQGWI